MGTLIDSSVFIAVERSATRASRRANPTTRALDAIVDSVADDEEIGIATITASELLHGVERAAPQVRARRTAFVEAVLAAVPSVPFDLAAARIHASLWAALLARHEPIGPHDLIIAATALAIGWSVATLNHREFARVPGLDVVVPALPSAG